MKKRREAKEIKRKDVLIAIDISGGNIDKDHLKAMLETFEVMVENYDYIGHVVLCDYEIRAEFEMDDYKEALETNLAGRGGSDYRPVFEYIKEKKEKENWDVFKIYYMTDGLGIFPRESEFDTIWVTGNDYGQFPFGEVALVQTK